MNLEAAQHIRANADYQQFAFDADGKPTDVGERMRKKWGAIDSLVPPIRDKTVLDLGTDMGFWAFSASALGARSVLGVDRGRSVRGAGFVDLVDLNSTIASQHRQHRDTVRFKTLSMGTQWHDLGEWDLVFLMSCYHHIYAVCGDHEAAWHWVRAQTKTGGHVVYEGPLNTLDPVVQKDVPVHLQGDYNETAILGAMIHAGFSIESEILPSEHEPDRYALRLVAEPTIFEIFDGVAVSGAGGATKAFEHNAGGRMMEIERALGFKPFPGTLNVQLAKPFDWDGPYFRSWLLELQNRAAGLEHGVWAPRGCRFYPVDVSGVSAFAMRWEGDHYPENFLELVAPVRLRDKVGITRDNAAVRVRSRI